MGFTLTWVAFDVKALQHYTAYSYATARAPVSAQIIAHADDARNSRSVTAALRRLQVKTSLTFSRRMLHPLLQNYSADINAQTLPVLLSL